MPGSHNSAHIHLHYYCSIALEGRKRQKMTRQESDWTIPYQYNKAQAEIRFTLDLDGRISY